MTIKTLVSSEFTSNTYLIITGEHCLIIDPGVALENIVNQWQAANVKPMAILLTHGHFDHIYSASQLQKQFQLPIYLHEKEAILVNDRLLNGADMFNVPGTYTVEPIIIKDNQILTIADLRFKVIHTPFHTLGSVCYYLEEEKILFSGDTLFKGSIGRSDLPTGSFKTIKSSLQKLQKLSPKTKVYPGHGPLTTIKEEKQTNPYFLPSRYNHR
jgi:hydroxyacylglutathione hydrolase